MFLVNFDCSSPEMYLRCSFFIKGKLCDCSGRTYCTRARLALAFRDSGNSYLRKLGLFFEDMECKVSGVSENF